MTSNSPASRDLARRLLAFEIARGESAGWGPAAASAPPAALVFGKLRAVMVTFAGIAGFRSLLTRALKLAVRLAPELKGVTVNADGSLAGLESVESEKRDGAPQEWEETLITQLLDLLVTFVGEGLMLQMVTQAWPDLLAGQIRSRTEDKS